MSLQTRLESLISAIGPDIKDLRTRTSALEAGGGGAAPAGTKISALPTAVSLDGTESVPILQAGVTEKISVTKLQPWLEQVLVSNYVNSTVTASDVFTGFTPLANTRYLVDALITGMPNISTSGIQTGLTGPSTGITRSAVKIISSASSSTDMITHTALNNFQIAVGNSATAALISIQAIIEVGATPGAGNIRVQARSEVAATNAVLLYPGSNMRWRVI